MLIRKDYIENDGLLGIWKISESNAGLIHLLPENQREEAKKYISTLKSNRRIQEWLTTRTLLFALIGEEKMIVNDDDGRPFLEDNSYHISISHTKNYVAVLLHKRLIVGVDIETISERVNKIAGKFVSEKEFIDMSQTTIHRLLHWSAKETMFKMLDGGGIDFKKHLFIEPFTPQSQGIIRGMETKTALRNDYAIHYEVHADFVLTWALNER